MTYHRCALIGLVACWTLVPAVSGYAGSAADIDHYMPNYVLDRMEVSYTCFDLVPRFIFEGKADSLFAVLDYWDRTCGPAEPLIRTRILANIWQDSFSEDLYDHSIFDDLIRYRWDPEGEGFPSWSSAPARLPTLVEYTPGYFEYNAFTANLADQLLPHLPRDSVEKLFCQFYTGRTDSLFSRLQQDDFRHTRLRAYYEQEVAGLLERIDVELGLFSGLWKPRGGLRVVGTHPTIGGFFGLRDRRFFGRAIVEYRFLDAREEYIIHNRGQFVFTSHYLSFYIGAEGGMSLSRTRHHGLDVFVGLGYDTLQPFTAEETVLSALSTDLGVGYRFYFGDCSSKFIGCDLCLVDVGYNNDGGDDLSGGAWNLRISIGIRGDDYRDRRLQSLEYDRWR